MLSKRVLGDIYIMEIFLSFQKSFQLFDKTKRQTKIDKAFIYDTVSNKYELFIQINYFVRHVRQAFWRFDIKPSLWQCGVVDGAVSPCLPFSRYL
jgi:hypothetical protein